MELIIPHACNDEVFMKSPQAQDSGSFQVTENWEIGAWREHGGSSPFPHTLLLGSCVWMLIRIFIISFYNKPVYIK